MSLSAISGLSGHHLILGISFYPFQNLFNICGSCYSDLETCHFSMALK
jgi:hypothetical protein